MILNPMLPLPLLVAIAVLAAAAVGYAGLKSARAFPRAARWTCALLEACAVALIILLFANPGFDEEKIVSDKPVWMVAVDKSASMKAPSTSDASSPSRAAVAAATLQKLKRYATSEREIIWLSPGLETTPSDADELASLPSTGESSPLSARLQASLAALQRQGRLVAGVVLVSDGIDTGTHGPEALVMQARAQNVPIHTMVTGGAWKAPDLRIDASRPLVEVFRGAPLTLRATLQNVSMGNRQVRVRLLDSAGKERAAQVISAPNGQSVPVAFAVGQAEDDGFYTIECAAEQGESRVDNNSVTLAVHSVDSRIRIFMAEGAPYWDSKFLAQYLRNQPEFDVHSVHRLSDDRLYTLHTGDETESLETETTFPADASAFLRYDIVLLGKGMEHLLTPATAEALASWVRERGGLLIFARGKCYGGSLPAMEALEPFSWTRPAPDGEYRILPSAAEKGSGLFGTVLPAPEDAAWRSLPGLDDVWEVALPDRQTRVLASSGDGGMPMIATRRIGLGAVACINGEGLWKWDFYPQARERGNLYTGFWKEFLPWIQTAAEFKPGFDLSLHAARRQVEKGEPIDCTLSWRGMGSPGPVEVELVACGKAVPHLTVKAACKGEVGGLKQWTATLPTDIPGSYILRPRLPEQSGIARPELAVTVLAPPTEYDRLDADRGWLQRLSEHTGGRALAPETPDEDWDAVFTLPEGNVIRETAYRPAWAQWPLLALIGAALGLAWWIRRRHGLL